MIEVRREAVNVWQAGEPEQEGVSGELGFEQTGRGEKPMHSDQTERKT